MTLDEHTLVTGFLTVVLVVLSAGVAVLAAINAYWPMAVLVAFAYFVAFAIGRVLTLREIGEDIFN